MIDRLFSRLRAFFVTAAAWHLCVLALLVSACESPLVFDVFQDDKEAAPVSPPQPPEKASSQEKPSLIWRPLPKTREEAARSRGGADDKEETPSLVPLLTGRNQGQYDTTRLNRPGEVAALPPGPPPPPPLGGRVALLLPLSGPNAALGRAMRNAAQLAMFSFADNSFELLFQDTRGTPEGAIDAARLAIGDGASLILGPLLSSSVKAITPAVRAANVPVLAFSSDRMIAGDGIYTMGFLPGAEIEEVLRYAYKRGALRFAVLAPDNEYGAMVTQTFRRVIDDLGASVNQIKFYDPHASDFSGVIRSLADYENRRQNLLEQMEELEDKEDEISIRALDRLKQLQTIGDLPFDALLLADGGDRLQAIAALLPFYDIDPAKVRILGTGQWDVSGLGNEPALVGGWFAAPPPSLRKSFEKQYQDVYGKKPPRLVTLAYDATALAAFLGRSKGGLDFSAEALTQRSGFVGRDGVFRLLPEGVTERGLAVLQVGRRGSRVIARAPKTFAR
jgi:branched-chain amino acid transport system substrate-binding protein